MIEPTYPLGAIFAARSGAQYYISAAYGGHGSFPEIYHLALHKPVSVLLRLDQERFCVTLHELQKDFDHLSHLERVEIR